MILKPEVYKVKPETHLYNLLKDIDKSSQLLESKKSSIESLLEKFSDSYNLSKGSFVYSYYKMHVIVPLFHSNPNYDYSSLGRFISSHDNEFLLIKGSSSKKIFRKDSVIYRSSNLSDLEKSYSSKEENLISGKSKLQSNEVYSLSDDSTVKVYDYILINSDIYINFYRCNDETPKYSLDDLKSVTKPVRYSEFIKTCEDNNMISTKFY